MLYLFARQLLAIKRKNAGAAFAGARSVIFEVEQNGVRTWRIAPMVALSGPMIES